MSGMTSGDGVGAVDVAGLVLTVLAVARVTRLVNRDVLLEKVRARLLTRLTDRGWDMAAYLVVCPWCLSMYVGALGALAWTTWGHSVPYMCVVLALSASYVTGFLASKESE